MEGHFDSFESELKNAIQRWSAQPDSPFRREIPSKLLESIEYSLFAPGKRIRPRFVLATGEMLGLSPEALFPPAIALEMIHCFTLIHDDLPCMDDDDFRRGRPSNHKVFGEAMALLAGDSLPPLALEIFLEAAKRVSQPEFLAGLHVFLDAVGPRGVMGGQALEFVHERKSPDLKVLEAIHDAKTGALFHASILIPKAFAGISDRDPKGAALIEFSKGVGQLFQIADDISDREQDQASGNAISVLQHLDVEGAKKLARGQCDRLTALLNQNWGAQSQALQEITRQILVYAGI